MNLKLATMEDADTVVKLVTLFVKASPYKDLPYDTQKIKETVLGLLRDKNKGIVILYMKDGVPVGILGGMLTEMLFSREPVAAELFWWVDPQFRSRKSLSLMEAFEFWAQRVGAKHIQMGAVSALDNKVERYYRRRGYENLENSYLRTL